MSKKVLVAMSGGVDSSAAALLLLEQGWEVEGATFRLWEQSDRDAADAAAVCAALGVRHHILDYRKPFREKVVDYFADEYRAGRTPNPCVQCNRHIKFGAFLDSADELGCGYISTGHYAFVEYDPHNNLHRIKRASNSAKDQSYVLYTLTQRQLSRLVLPLGGYAKEEVRSVAARAGLAVSSKSDSQDVCFIPDGDYGAFLDRYTGEAAEPGDFLDTAGNPMGRHRGIRHYTIGQRKGLGISFGKPVYVSAIDPARNTVTLADNEALFSRELLADRAVFTQGELTSPSRFGAKIRYSAKAAPATVYPAGSGRVRVEFDNPQRAATPGQAVVFYDGEYIAGGATILPDAAGSV